MRKIILFVLGIVLLVVTILVAYQIANPEVEPDPTLEKTVQNVFVDTVKNGEVPIYIPATGSVLAKERLELFSEVEGLFEHSSRDFKAGQKYNRGETLISINREEYSASVQSAKSELYNLITAAMPDLRLDYPDAYQKWQTYLSDFSMNKPTPPLPEFSSDQEKYFISGRNILTTYHQLRNMEQRLGKFTVRAPFNGVLTEALVTRGTLIRPGQKLGEFINPGVYEMEVPVRASVASLLKEGEQVSLSNLEKTETYQGTIKRINARINAGTQTVNVFIEINDNRIKEGMFLEAMIRGETQTNAYKMLRRLMVNESQIFAVENDKLKLIDVTPVYYSAEHVVLKDIPEGTLVLSRRLPGAYSGQMVKTMDASKMEKN